MRVLAFAGSNSSQSINKHLVIYTCEHFDGHEIQLLDLNKYEMPIFSIDRENESGIPEIAFQFSEKIGWADLLLISLAEHNGAYSAAFKNIFDWVSRIPNITVFQDKPIFLMATSTGGRGGASVLAIAENRFPRNGGRIIDTFSLPKFNENFATEKGISTSELRAEFEAKIKGVIAQLSPDNQ